LEIEPLGDKQDSDPRNLRVVQWLTDNFDITVALFGCPGLDLGGFVNEASKSRLAYSTHPTEWLRVGNKLSGALRRTKSLFLEGESDLFGAVFMECQPSDQLWFLHRLNRPGLVATLGEWQI